MKTLFTALLISCALHAQQKQPVTSVQPDCIILFRLSVISAGAQATSWLPNIPPPPGSAGTSQVIDNHQAACYGWTVAYASHGFSGGVSLHFQSAPDNTSGLAPGTWSDFAGTLTACTPGGSIGINPNTSNTQAITCANGLFPWVRMNLTAATGTGAVVGILYGFKVNSANNGSGGGGLCPGAGVAGDVQYTDGTKCVSAADFLYSLANDQVLIPPGGVSPAFPGLGFVGFPTVGLYYNAANGGPGIDDTPFLLTATGSMDNTFVYQDNDSWRCRESDQMFQRGVCEVFSVRDSNNAHFFDLTDTFVNWGDPAGGGAGNKVGVGRFSSEGATAGAVHVATFDGGSHLPIEPKDLVKSFTNEGTTGTTLHKLAKLTGAPSTVIISTAGDTGGVIGIVDYGAGTTGTSMVTTVGITSCVFDGATTAGNYVTISGTVNGDCHDDGSAYPAGTQVLGRVLSTNGGGGTFNLTLFNAEIQQSTAPATPQLHAITFVIDGAGSAITTGALKDFPTANFACTINKAQISADQSGSITVDIWKAAGAIPTSGNKISASAPVTLSASQLNQNSSLTGWTTSVSVGDVFGFNVATAATVTHVVGQIWCQ